MVEAEKVLGRSEGHQASRLEKSDTLAEKNRFADVVRDENDGFVEAASEGTEFTLKFGTSDGIESAERLIHK
jgi:hypothetical protein